MKLFHGIILEKTAILNEEESKHAIKVLRLNINSKIEVTDGLGKMIHGEIIGINKKVEIKIIKFLENNYNPIQKLHIAIAPTKNIDRFEFFIEKATELGIYEITPILTKNSERKVLNHEKLQKKIISASKQSIRSKFPILNPVTNLDDFIKLPLNKTIFVAHCNEKFNRLDILNINIENPIVLIGPEGDFSENEIKKMIDLSIPGINLGNQRLRTETAGIFVASYFYSKSL